MSKLLPAMVKILLVLLMATEFSMTEAEVVSVKEYDLKQECGIYFKTEYGFWSSGTDCEYQSITSPASYIFSIRDINYELKDNEKEEPYWFVSYASSDRLVYTTAARYLGAGHSEKILRQMRVDSLKKTKNDLIIVSLIRGKMNFDKYHKYYICWDGLFFDKNSKGGAALNLCETYKKGSPLVSLNSWQAKLMKSVTFHFPPRKYSPGFDCTNADTPVEKMICMNDALSEQDAALAAKYKQIAADNGVDRAQLVTEQRAWLKERNTCTTVECIQDAYTQRIDELQRKYPAKP